MANQVKVDAENLRQFGQKLNQAADACTNLFQHLTTETHRVCESWSDEKAIKFMQDFDISTNNIDKTAQQMRDFSAYISRLAQRVDDYNNQR